MNFLRAAEGRTLFERIVASPDDDSPRAELAEWLRERNEPLGEFIALQLKKKKKKKKNLKRETRLRMDHEADWLGPIHAIVDGPSIVFERGFVTSLRIEAPHDSPDREFLAELRAATGHPALSLVRTISLGGGVVEGIMHTRKGRTPSAAGEGHEDSDRRLPRAPGARSTRAPRSPLRAAWGCSRGAEERAAVASHRQSVVRHQGWTV